MSAISLNNISNKKSLDRLQDNDMNNDLTIQQKSEEEQTLSLTVKTDNEANKNRFKVPQFDWGTFMDHL